MLLILLLVTLYKHYNRTYNTYKDINSVATVVVELAPLGHCKVGKRRIYGRAVQIALDCVGVPNKVSKECNLSYKETDL